MRIRDLIEQAIQTKLPGVNKAKLRTRVKRRRPVPSDQEQMDAAANEHRVDIAPPEAPPDAACRELHGTPWVPPTFT